MKWGKNRWRGIVLTLLAAVALVAGCAREEGDTPAGRVQAYYGGLHSASTNVTVTADSGVIMEYELSVEKNDEQSSATVVAPAEIAGVRCVMTENGTKLQYDDAELETLLPPIAGFTPVDCVDGLLNTLAGAAPTEWCSEAKNEVDCLSLTYEMESGDHKAMKRVWLAQDDLRPVWAEWYLEGDQIMHAAFAGFTAESEG